MQVIVLRNLRDDESLDDCGRVVPRDESAHASLNAHIMGKRLSQFVSGCKPDNDARNPKNYYGFTNAWAQCLAYMLYQAKHYGAKLRIAAMHVELSAQNVYDVSTRELGQAHKLGGQGLNWAAKAREVCVEGRVPAVLVVDQKTWESAIPTPDELNAAEAAIKEYRKGFGSSDPYKLGANLLLDATVFALTKEDTAASTGLLKVVLSRNDIMSMLK